MFATAKTLNPKTKPASKSDKKKRFEVEGLYELTVLDTVLKNVTSLKKSVELGVKAAAATLFMDEAKAVGKRPDNFRGFESDAEASVECRKRSERSPLSESEVKELTDAGVPVGTVEDVSDTFVVNPEYATDMKLLLKVEKALAGVKDLPPDFFLKQVGKARSVVTDETVDAVFASEELTEKFFETVTVLAVKPKLTKGDFSTALGYLNETLS